MKYIDLSGKKFERLTVIKLKKYFIKGILGNTLEQNVRRCEVCR